MESVQQLADNVMLLGNGKFNFYLVGKQEAALFECGCSVGAEIFARQFAQLTKPPMVKYIVLLHSHFDHSCGLPRLQSLFPQAEVLGSAACQKILGKEKLVRLFYSIDQAVSQRYMDEGLIASIPPDLPAETLKIDRVVGEGDMLALSGGPDITFLATPGHSVCSLSAWIEPDKMLLHSDAAGILAGPEWIAPAFFSSYPLYLNSIDKLAAYGAQLAGGGHGEVIRGRDEVAAYYQLSRRCAVDCREDILARLKRGEMAENIVEALYTSGASGGIEYYPQRIMMDSMAEMLK